MPGDGKPPRRPPTDAGEPGPEDEDFVFRFSLEATEPESGAYEEPLLELIRGQLADLLDAVVLTYHGKRVRVDGFRLLQDPDTQYRIHPEADSAGTHLDGE